MSMSGGVDALATRIALEINSLRSTSVKNYSETFTASSTVHTITHNLGTRGVLVQLFWNVAPYESFWATIRRINTNQVEIHFATAPNESVTVLVQGG